MLLAVLAVGALSVKTQPATSPTAAWWPAAGIALALGIRFPRRYTWILAVAVAAVTLPVALWAGRPPPLAIALSVAVSIEMIVGTLLLRGRQDRAPTLYTPRDLGRFLLIAVATSVLYALLAAGSSWLLGDIAGAWDRLLTSAPKHAAGMLLLTPLFMALPRRLHRASYVESAAQLFAALAVAVAVFVVNESPLSLAFLMFLPLVWAALRMSTRLLFLVMLVIAVIASAGSAYGTGPFSFDRLGITVGTVTLQVFQMSMVVVFLALSLVVGSERATSLRLHESEQLFVKSFNSSVAGKLMVTRGPVHWTVDRSNPSARELLPGLADGVALDAVLGPDATGMLAAAADSLVVGNARLALPLADGRSLDVSIAVITERATGTLLTLHFNDITESLRVRQLEQDELNRAAEVQRALRPDELPATPGWTLGTCATPARQVGGDFFDLRMCKNKMVASLGDVMGKGMDAGMLAAATRAVLRTHDPSRCPSEVVTETARVLGGDLKRISAFVTLAYVLVDMNSGDFLLTDAGHGLFFIARAESGQIERMASDDMPLGLGERWAAIAGRLAPGDMLLLVSDGVLDLWGGAVDELQEAITECANRDGISPQAFVDELCAAPGGDVDVDDDVTAVALRRER
ncbi:SpoIIE family protein phosphatase [Mycolicibacterium hodleri]|uniref:Serine/threonine protein phosphatase n=1 Tax=Mycolicibacterium hodleri TaxID=49897 RepID=A0A502DUB2_9MYCO|nr:SpoIIE family protein phosphatase [Mycolicibacterium hodleri]TPG28240.1 serine/threonine protein phosphatase [Mycolicibacterium hodleri]